MPWVLRAWCVGALALLGPACGLADAGGVRTVVAHRGGAAYFPENSRSAVRAAITRGYPALEVDVSLTQDAVPVLAHDPWLSEALCTSADGQPLTERVYIRDLTLEALQAGFLCGGVPDPSTPDAEVLADVVMTLDELLLEVRGHDTQVYLDLKYGPDTLPIEDFRREIVGRWRQARLPNRLFVESGFDEGVRAFASEAGITTLVSWPRFDPDTSGVGLAVGTEVSNTLGFNDPIDRVRDLGAHGFAATYETVKRRTAIAAQDAGIVVALFTLNGEALLDRYCGWPVDLLITDFPERASCL
jgi:glycerophosphoryl diester phosphodiesterase